MFSTKSLRNFSYLAIIASIICSFFISPSVYAQYNGSSGGMSNNANVSVSDNVLTINFFNITPGSQINVTGLSFNGLTGVMAKFNSACSNATMRISPLSTNQVMSNLPNTLIQGYAVSFADCPESALDSLSFDVSMSADTYNAMVSDSVRGFFYRGNMWNPASEFSFVSNSNGMVTLRFTGGLSSQFAVSGTRANTNLLRTGGNETFKAEYLAIATISVMLGLLYLSLKTSKKSA
jgi:hypothetical protein